MDNQLTEKRILKKGDIVFEQGKYEEWMYDILKGKVGVYSKFGTEDEKLIAELGENTFLGEMGMIDCYPRSATAVCLEDDTCIRQITKEDFSEYFNGQHDRIYDIMRQLSQKIRKTTDDYLKLCNSDSHDLGEMSRTWGNALNFMKRIKTFGENHLNLGTKKDGTHRKGEVIFIEGDYEPFMYDIQYGKICLYSDYGKPDQRLIAELGEDNLFGEMGLIGGCPRIATAVVMETGTRLQAIDAETFNEYFKSKPAKVLTLMQHMTKRLRELNYAYLKAKSNDIK